MGSECSQNPSTEPYLSRLDSTPFILYFPNKLLMHHESAARDERRPMINLYVRTLSWIFFDKDVKDSTDSSVGLFINTIFIKVIILLLPSHFNTAFATYFHCEQEMLSLSQRSCKVTLQPTLGQNPTVSFLIILPTTLTLSIKLTHT